MAISAFIPTIWSRRILDRLRENLVHAPLFNRDYEGEIRAAGNTVKIPTYAPVITVGDHNRNADLPAVQDIDVGETQDLVVDQEKTYRFRVHDLNRAQSQVELMRGAMDDAAFRLAKTMDAYVGGLLNGVDVTGRLITDPSKKTDKAQAHGKNYVNSVIALAELMDDANIPTEGRWMVVPPRFMRRVQRHLVNADQAGALFAPATVEQSLRNGFLGTLSGFRLYQTTSVQSDGAGDAKKLRCFASYGTVAGSFIQQVTETEALRDQDRFADIVRGLVVYGAKVVLPDRVFRLDILNVAA